MELNNLGKIFKGGKVMGGVADVDDDLIMGPKSNVRPNYLTDIPNGLKLSKNMDTPLNLHIGGLDKNVLNKFSITPNGLDKAMLVGKLDIGSMKPKGMNSSFYNVKVGGLNNNNLFGKFKPKGMDSSFYNVKMKNGKNKLDKIFNVSNDKSQKKMLMFNNKRQIQKDKQSQDGLLSKMKNFVGGQGFKETEDITIEDKLGKGVGERVGEVIGSGVGKVGEGVQNIKTFISEPKKFEGFESYGGKSRLENVKETIGSGVEKVGSVIGTGARGIRSALGTGARGIGTAIGTSTGGISAGIRKFGEVSGISEKIEERKETKEIERDIKRKAYEEALKEGTIAKVHQAYEREKEKKLRALGLGEKRLSPYESIKQVERVRQPGRIETFNRGMKGLAHDFSAGIRTAGPQDVGSKINMLVGMHPGVSGYGMVPSTGAQPFPITVGGLMPSTGTQPFTTTVKQLMGREDELEEEIISPSTQTIEPKYEEPPPQYPLPMPSPQYPLPMPQGPMPPPPSYIPTPEPGAPPGHVCPPGKIYSYKSKKCVSYTRARPYKKHRQYSEGQYPQQYQEY